MWREKYIAWGISFFPLKDRDKKPAISWEEYQHRRPTQEELEKWERDKHTNYGAVCGAVSDNLVVLDIDNKNLFDELNLKELARETFTVETGKGYHIYLKTESPVMRKSLQWNGKEEIRFQGEGSYVVTCGSIHPTGKKYTHYRESPLEIKKYSIRVLEDIEKRWKRYHGLDKVEEKRKVLESKTKRGKDLEEFKRKVGMQIIEKYVKPVRKYSRYWQGLCPFHNDSNPSFTVYEDEMSWYCFGCQKYGDVINFVQEIENVDFISAIKIIEGDTGIEFFQREKDDKLGDGEEKKRISHATLAEMIMNMHDFITLRDTEEVLWWDGKKWNFNGESKIKELCQRIIAEIGKMEKATNHIVNETIGFIQRATYIDRYLLNREKRKIPLLNGVYDIESGELIPSSPEFYFTYCLPIEYDEKADCPKIKKFLKEVLVEEDIPPLLEFIGYSCIPEQKFHKALMLVGDGANGKSTLIELVRSFLGKGNTSSVSLQSLLENRFAISSLYGKLANLYADLPDETLRRTGIFKMIAGGDTISAEKKFKPSFEFNPTCKLIFSANKIPKTFDDTSAFFRRWIILNFPNKFEGNDRDPNIIDKITESSEMSGFFNLVIEHLKNLLKRGDFSHSKSTEEVREDYIRKSDPVSAFVIDYTNDGRLHEDTYAFVTKDELYAEFVKYCKKIKLPAVDKGVFTKNLKYAIPSIQEERRTVNGVRVRCWKGIKLEKEEIEEKDKIVVRIIKDIPTFVDPQDIGKTWSFKNGDIVSLSPILAKTLIDKKVAEEVVI